MALRYTQALRRAILVVTGPGGESTSEITIEVTGVVGPLPPVVNFTAVPLSGVIPLLVQFTDASTGEIDTWAWDFGDDLDITFASDEQNPLHTFTAVGNFTVTLRVTGPGGTSTASLVISVTAEPPTELPSIINAAIMAMVIISISAVIMPRKGG